MSGDVNTLVLQMSADLRKFERSMERMNSVANKRLSAVEAQALKSQRNLSRIMDNAGRGMVGSLRSSLGALAPTLAAAFSVGQVVRYADAYTGLQNRLKAAGLEGERLKTVEDQLYAAANRNGVAIDAVAQMYQRVSQSRQSLGATDEQLIGLTNGVTAALRVQGVTAEQASGPLLQLGQALGAGTVRAEELNSLLEGTPILLQAAAKGSQKYSGDVSKLAAAIRKGEVSSKEFFNMLLTGLPELEGKAASMSATVGQALETLNNQLGRYVGQTDSGLSATERMAQGIKLLADNLDVAVPVAATLAAVMSTRLVLALTMAVGAKTAATVATARLTAFQIAMTASMTGATRAQVALNMAMAANPVGFVLTAVVALAGGLYLLAQRYNLAAVAQRNMKTLQEAAQSTLSDYQQAVLDAANASDKEREALQKKAAALREVQQERLNDMRIEAQRQRVEAESSRQLAATRRAEANDTRSRVGANAGSNAGAALVGGARALADGQERLAKDAEQRATDAEKAVTDMEAAIRRAETINRATIDTPTGDDKKGSKKSGPTPEELAAMREMLRLQGEVAVLQAKGDEDGARAIQRQIDLINLTKQYKDAEVQNAAEAAREYLTTLHAAEDAARAREKTEKQIDEMLEARQKQIDREREIQRLLNEQLLDRLGYEAELARLAGHEGRIKNAERELWIAERINEILRIRPQLTRGEAGAQASREYDALDKADREGRMRDEFRRSFRDGIKAAIDGDMAGFFEGLADRFTDRVLDNLADNLFDVMSNAMKGLSAGGGGGGVLSGLMGMLGLSGKRASGGAVVRGQSYLVGERKPEVFVPSQSGTIIPSVNRAMGQVQAGVRAVSQQFIVQVDAKDAVLTETVQGWVRQGMEQATARAVQTSTSIARKSAPMLQHSQHRLGAA